VRPLFDNNLSPRLPLLLADLFPGGEHVARAGLRHADDLAIRAFAAAHGFAVVSKDVDHRNLAVTLGTPPKVVWVRLGNCPVRQLEAVMRHQAAALLAFAADPAVAVFELW
jgi:predicted nuclease of predicted toxin-antitoxin system